MKADDAAIYNISFLGTKPANTTAAAASLYGKYLIPTYGAAAFGAAVAAPEDVDVNAPLAQWVVSAVSGRNFEFKNRETNVTFTVSMYKTDKAGEYAISTAALSTGTAVTGIVAGSVDLTDISNWKYQIVKLTPTTESEGFLALTDAQLSQQTELVFNGTGSVTVEKLYMAYKEGTSPYFVPINNPAYSVQWMFEKAESVKNKMKYAYLDGTDVKQKDSVVNVATSYLLYNLKNDNSKQYFGGVTSDYKAATAKDDAKRVFFKKNVDGTYAMIELGKTDITAGNDEVNYSGLIKYDANKWSVNTTTAVFDAASATLDELNAPYSAVTVDFNALSESLEAVARHATFNSEEGAVAVKQNKNGILEGIIGEGMTFWLDTADIDKDFHSFYISKGNGEEEARDFLYFATDSMLHWDANKADYVYNAPNYYLYNLNGKLGFTNQVEKALVVTLGKGDATANEDVEVAAIKVIAGEGNVTIAGAAGKKVVISNILGQVVANTVVSSDNATIAAPQGIVVVAVEGEEAVKAIVK